ncbi:MAG: hypothetical protein ACFFEY_14505 [Candidatus Thorarchaeota archaeon]
MYFHPKIKSLSPVKKLREEGKIKEALEIVLELEKGEDLSLKEILSYKLAKANLLSLIGNYLDAIEIAKEIFQEFEKLGDLASAFDALIIQGFAYMLTINLAKAEVIIKQAKDLLKNYKEKIALDLRERQSSLLMVKAAIAFFKGDIQHSLELNNRAYELVKDSGKLILIAGLLNNIADKYHHLKEYDKAVEYAKKAIECNIEPQLITALATLIEIYISKGDIQEAKVSLNLLRERTEKLDTKRHKILYYSSKANILKSSLRARDRIKAEDIFKKLALNDSLLSEPRINAIISLCDLYLTELGITNDVKIINEIQPYIKTLLNIAEQRHLYLYLAETYLLQAKLSLLTLDLKQAKRFLTQAQKIAESYGIKRLAMKISYEHDELLRQTNIWENLKISEVSISERLKLVGLNEQMKNMLKRQMIKVPKISKEDPVMLLFLTEGGTLLFSKKFVEDFSFEDDVLGGILTTINYIINELFSEGLDRAVFGPYTLLMVPIQPFLACYIFKGDSYFAHNKIKNFADSIQKNNIIWQSLQNFLQTSKSVQLNDIPSLESMVMEIFIEKENFWFQKET